MPQNCPVTFEKAKEQAVKYIDSGEKTAPAWQSPQQSEPEL